MVVVLGGGVVGLAVAWRVAARGLRVTVVDPDPGRGASHAAGGMLAPVTEAHYGEERLLALNAESSRRWPAFAAELERVVGRAVGYRTDGTLVVALDAADRATLADLADYRQSLGLAAQRLTGRECRRAEPLLSPEVTGGLLVEGDHSVDNRALVAALLAACCRSGVAFVRERAVAVHAGAGRVEGVLLAGGDRLPAHVVVLAAGVGSAGVGGIPAGEVPVRPVKGEILRLAVPAHLAPVVTRTVRAVAGGEHVYMVPREGGELVVGATSSELTDTAVTAGGVYRLLRDARRVLPAVDELEVGEVLARLRPGTPDNAPLLGETSLPGLVTATGHYRNGVLLAPVTADAVADLVVDGALPPVAQPFTPARFARAAAGPSTQEVPAWS